MVLTLLAAPQDSKKWIEDVSQQPRLLNAQIDTVYSETLTSPQAKLVSRPRSHSYFFTLVTVTEGKSILRVLFRTFFCVRSTHFRRLNLLLLWGFQDQRNRDSGRATQGAVDAFATLVGGKPIRRVLFWHCLMSPDRSYAPPKSPAVIRVSRAEEQRARGVYKQ